ncbi:MAG: hypothetical protein HQK54_03045 [Oligoflexales bacterium]|nr:hypothetical protein [Oligoflexales bacterium]
MGSILFDIAAAAAANAAISYMSKYYRGNAYIKGFARINRKCAACSQLDDICLDGDCGMPQVCRGASCTDNIKPRKVNMCLVGLLALAESDAIKVNIKNSGESMSAGYGNNRLLPASGPDASGKTVRYGVEVDSAEYQINIAKPKIEASNAGKIIRQPICL